MSGRKKGVIDEGRKGGVWEEGVKEGVRCRSEGVEREGGRGWNEKVERREGNK